MQNVQERNIKKPMSIMLLILAIIFGGIFAWKGFGSFMMHRYIKNMGTPPVTISTVTVVSTPWQPQIKAVASLRAVLGVNITAQLAGMITNTYIKPGSTVTKGTLLVQQNADPNIAQLHAQQANAELALITYNRDKLQFQVKAISKQQLDTDQQNLLSANAQVVEQAATVDKLTIRAPFNGQLGISRVYPGQFLNPGDQIVTLQTLDPVYADFFLPQQALAHIEVGQAVSVVADTFPDEVFTGNITTINPVVDTDTRNVEVEATLSNPKFKLLPGMFANTTIISGKSVPFLTVPQTAVSFNPYGNLIYVVKETGKDNAGKPVLTATQVFVTTGETRGDQIAILSGVKEGDVIVSSGQLKLKNGSQVIINNSLQPSNNPAPDLPNEHGQQKAG